MKKLIIVAAACLMALCAQAQPMGGRPPMGGMPPMGGPMGPGMEKPFYQQESDSIATARITDVAGRLDLNEKQFDKMVKLYAQEFEELCRNLQMAVMEFQMSSNGRFNRDRNLPAGAQPQSTAVFDTEAARKTYNQIIEKYNKRFSKAISDEQYETWKELSGTTLDNKFSSILQHVQDNTESFF